MKKRRMHAEDLRRLETVSDAQISPDGRRVAYVVGRNDSDSDEIRTHVWVAAADGTGARRFSNGNQDASPRWSPDGRWLAYLSRRDGPPQLVLAPLEGGEPEVVTEGGAVSAPAWSPDSTRIAYVARVGGQKPKNEQSPAERNAPRVLTELANRMDGIGWFDGRGHVFVLDVAGRTSRQITRGDFDDASPAWSPDGQQLVFSSDRRTRRDDLPPGMRSDAWVVPVAGGRPTRLTHQDGAASFPQVSPDGTTVAFTGHRDRDEFWSRPRSLFLVPIDGGEPRMIARRLDRSVATAFLPAVPFAWRRDGKAIVFIATTEGNAWLHEVSIANDAVRTIVTGDRQIDSFSLSTDSRVTAFATQAIDAWPAICVKPRQGDEREVSGANAELAAEVELVTAERRTHVAADGTTVESFLLRPNRKGRSPLALDIHGGPHGMHPMGLAMHYMQSLAAAGFAVLLPNPRGSGGYGAELQAACVGDWGGGDFDDLMGAVDATVEAGIADPDRLLCGGSSYGGFMTTWVIGHTRRFRAAVIGAPVIDAVSMFGTSDIPAFLVHELGGAPWERPDEYEKRSPLTYAREIRTPALILHWDGDLRCPVGQGEELYQTLKVLGREVVLARYPGGFHVARTPSQSIDRVTRVIDWYRQHIA